jgi:hypothetical protein
MGFGLLMITQKDRLDIPRESYREILEKGFTPLLFLSLNFLKGVLIVKSKWIKSFVIMVLLMCLMATPCYAVMIPQDSMTTTFSKSMNNPAASNDYWLVYGYNPAPYQVYRVAGSFRGNLSSSYTTYWQFRDSSGNVIYSFSTTGTNVGL